MDAKVCSMGLYVTPGKERFVSKLAGHLALKPAGGCKLDHNISQIYNRIEGHSMLVVARPIHKPDTFTVMSSESSPKKVSALQV